MNDVTMKYDMGLISAARDRGYNAGFCGEMSPSLTEFLRVHGLTHEQVSQRDRNLLAQELNYGWGIGVEQVQESYQEEEQEDYDPIERAERSAGA